MQTLKRYWRLLAHYLRPEWPRMIILLLVLGGSIAAQVLAPLVNLVAVWHRESV
jgi:hypothetical protein